MLLEASSFNTWKARKKSLSVICYTIYDTSKTGSKFTFNPDDTQIQTYSYIQLIKPQHNNYIES